MGACGAAPVSDDLPFSGERYVPGIPGEIAHEHWHRYAFACRYVAGRRILDAACGEGYGSALMSRSAGTVIGVDLDTATLDHARRAYRAVCNLSFAAGSITTLPLPNASVDVITSFETVEHVDAADQRRMLAEFDRVLAPEGLVVLSSPNRPQYSEARAYVNPFHRHELDRDELASLVSAHFPALRWYRQRRYFGSALWAEERESGFEALAGSGAGAVEAAPPEAMYFVIIAAREAASLPRDGPGLSLFTDRDEAELARLDAEARKVLALDSQLLACIRERDDERRRAAALEAKIAEARMEARTARAEFDAQLAAQERIIGERETLRWWLTLPRLHWYRVLSRLGLRS